VRLVPVNGVLPLPARTTEVLEALEVPAKVRSHDAGAHITQRVFQVGVDLNLEERRKRSLCNLMLIVTHSYDHSTSSGSSVTMHCYASIHKTKYQGVTE
jgi:hypothetical protein